MKKLMTLAMVALAAVAVAQDVAPEAAKNNRRNPERMQSRMRINRLDPATMAIMNPKIAEKIGVTAEQQAKIKELNEAFQAKSAELRKQLTDAQTKFNEELKAVLTSEQLEKAGAEMKAVMKERRGNRRGFRADREGAPKAGREVAPKASPEAAAGDKE